MGYKKQEEKYEIHIVKIFDCK